MTKFAFPAVLTEGYGPSTVTAFNTESSEPVFVANEFHPNWDAILDGLTRGDSNVWGLFDVAGAVMRRFQNVTERVSWDGENILFDGDVTHNSVASHLERIITSGAAERDIRAAALFMEKLAENPDEHSREQAYDWLSAHEFQITSEGDVVGYKGVTKTDSGYQSGWKSAKPDVPSAFVDGVPVPPLSYVPQSIGSVVTMPRSEVTHDPSQACERGLHVATRNYAGSYGTVLEVHVNPRDIVSVPTDAHGAKVRVCRYVVADVAGDKGSHPVLHDTSTHTTWKGDVGYKV